MASTPTKTDESNAAKIARGLVAGVIAGAVASFAMDRFQAAVSPLLPSNEGNSEPATEKAADAVATGLTGRAIPNADKPLAGQAVHYAVGIALGAAYGIAAEFRPSVAAGCGTAFGLGTATILDEVAVPATGLGSAPWDAGIASNLYSYASHLIFGGVSEIVRRQLAGTLTPRQVG
jgi:putative membrane protein